MDSFPGQTFDGTGLEPPPGKEKVSYIRYRTGRTEQLSEQIAEKRWVSNLQRILEHDFPKWSADGISALHTLKKFVYDFGDVYENSRLVVGKGTCTLSEKQGEALMAVLRNPGGFKYFVRVDECYEKLSSFLKAPNPHLSPLLSEIIAEVVEVKAKAEEAYSRATLEVSWVLFHPTFVEGTPYEAFRKEAEERAAGERRQGRLLVREDDSPTYHSWPYKRQLLTWALCSHSGGDSDLFSRLSAERNGFFTRERFRYDLHVEREDFEENVVAEFHDIDL